MVYYKIKDVLVPDDAYKKLGIMSTHNKIPIADIASQAIQEWMEANYGRRVPGNP